MKHFNYRGKKVAYKDVGQGIPVVLVHCSNANHREWSFLIDKLQGRYRLLAPDLLGYGDSDRWPPDEPFDPYTDVNVIQDLLTELNEPVHLVGHSYGGVLALEVARQGKHQIKSLTLIEPVVFQLLDLANKREDWARIEKMAKAIISAIKENKPAKAARAFMPYWMGRVSWWFMPRKMKEVIIDGMAKVAREFEIIHNVDIKLEDYESINIPVRLIVGTSTPRPARTLISILEKLLPNANTREIKGAGHMSPYTHKNDVYNLIAEHIQAND